MNIREELAKEIHTIQIESAKLNDAHTEGVDYFYIDWDELPQEMQGWYLDKADQQITIFKEFLKTMELPEYDLNSHDDGFVILAQQDLLKAILDKLEAK